MSDSTPLAPRLGVPRGAGSPPARPARAAGTVMVVRAAPGIHDARPSGHDGRGINHLDLVAYVGLFADGHDVVRVDRAEGRAARFENGAQLLLGELGPALLAALARRL